MILMEPETRVHHPKHASPLPLIAASLLPGAVTYALLRVTHRPACYISDTYYIGSACSCPGRVQLARLILAPLSATADPARMPRRPSRRAPWQ